MDPNEMPAMPCCLPNSSTGLETRAPWGVEPGPRRSICLCAHCHNHGITDQVKDQEHLCLFQACECHKEHHSILPAERDLKMEQGPYLKRRPTRERIRSRTTSPRAHSRAKKLGTQARVPIGKESITPQLEAHPCAIPEEESAASVGSSDLSHCPEPFLCPEDLDNLPRHSAARSGLGIFVSVLDSSTLEEATNNFSFEGVIETPCPAQQAPESSDQASVSDFSEWQRKLEAAEALLTLRKSSQAPSGSISLLQPCVAPAPDGDKRLQPSSPSL